MFKSVYKAIPATIEKIITESSNIKTFVLKPKEPILFTTGQFVEISIPGYGEAPFTPSSSPFDKEFIAVTIMKAGQVTARLHSMSAGDEVGIRGPYGIGYPVEKFFDNEVLILGGGVGMAPLRSFIFTLMSQIKKFKKVVLCYGSKTPEDVIFKDLFAELSKKSGIEVLKSVDKCSLRSEWDGEVGLVTCLLAKADIDFSKAFAVVCGPPIMMKFGTLKLLEMGFKPENIYLSMEANMSCGIGKCGHCQIGPYFVCKDGPVFSYDKLKDIPEPFA